MDISEINKRIEETDKEIMSLFDSRLELTREADMNLSQSEIALRCRKYEREFLVKLAEESGDKESFRRVLAATMFSLSHSYKLTDEIYKDSKIARQIKDAIEKTPKTFPTAALVACQGVEGAYSQIVTDKIFASADIRYFPTFEGVFKAVESGECRYGVLPIENSSYGSVIQVYDLMRDHKFHIIRSAKLQINHRLMTRPGVKMEDIKEVFSHQQALGQCSGFFKDHPDIKVTVAANTAIAARMVADSPRTDIAAISSPDCADLYGLTVIRDDIQNTDHNFTRFICITKDLNIYPGASRISMMMTLSHTPGALSELLTKFSSLGVNLTKIESRPIVGRDFEFMFYLDVDASVYSDNVLALLSELDAESPEFTFLGSYLEI